MMKWFAFIVISLSIFGLLTGSEHLLPYVLLASGIIMLITGFSDWIRKEKLIGLVLVAHSLIEFIWAGYIVFL
ncbi:hypothetical protein LF817_05530 [Halobacillus sp. A1]|uniref:hypothetical protein n=1 Tax=Halobacillus sp. A1 TaxID=2880262 RepID=UPI0020A693CD|nr:hypothetical protein [Halobacillus sp. A1]MCP3030798.1 hypothetical protein [Halobacillus sp. A1]